MEIVAIDHIGIMVKNCRAAAENYAQKIGLQTKEILVATDFDCKIAFLPCNGVKIELVEPADVGPGRESLNNNGEGLHHICYIAKDFEDAYKEAYNKGLVRDDGIRMGAEGKRVFFIPAGNLCGVLTEICEPDNLT